MVGCSSSRGLLPARRETGGVPPSGGLCAGNSAASRHRLLAVPVDSVRFALHSTDYHVASVRSDYTRHRRAVLAPL